MNDHYELLSAAETWQILKCHEFAEGILGQGGEATLGRADLYNPPELWKPYCRTLGPWFPEELDYLYALEQNTDPWMQARKHFVGGSAVSVLTHQSKYLTAAQWVRANMNFYNETWRDPDSNYLICQHGHEFEAVTELFFQKITGLTMDHPGIMVHPIIPYMAVSPDAKGLRFASEYKSLHHKTLDDLGDYEGQGQSQCEVMDVPVQYLTSSWIHGNGVELSIQMVERNRQYFHDFMMPLIDETLTALEHHDFDFKSKLAHKIKKPEVKVLDIFYCKFDRQELLRAMEACKVPLEWRERVLCNS